VSLAYSALVYEWSYPEAEKEFKRAIDLRPGYATAHQYYSITPNTGRPGGT